jgi:thiol-disulfide isomerase/thioredoxin
VGTLRATDLYDCDKSKGINAVVLDESASWCGACQQESSELEALMTSSWKAEGVYFAVLMAQDDDSNPATTGTAAQWKAAFGLTDVAVVADPDFSMVGNTAGLPTNVLVDPRTMTIVSTTEGYGGPDPAVDQLAQKNR